MNQPDLLAALAAHPELPDAAAHALIDNGLRLGTLSANPNLRPKVRDHIWARITPHSSPTDGDRIDVYTLTVHSAGDPARLRRVFELAQRSGTPLWSGIVAGLIDVGGHDDTLWDALVDAVAAASEPTRRRQLARRLVGSTAPLAARRRLVGELSTESQLRFLIDHRGDSGSDATAAAWPSEFGSLGARTVWSYGLLRTARPDIAEAAADRIARRRPARRGDLFALVALTGGGPWPGLDLDDEPWRNSGLAWPLLLADPCLDPTVAAAISSRHGVTDPWDRTRDDVDLDIAVELITAGAGWLTSTRLSHLDNLDELLSRCPLDAERRDMWDTARRAATHRPVGLAAADRIEIAGEAGEAIDTSVVDELIDTFGNDAARWRLALTLIDGADVDDLAALVGLAFGDTGAVTGACSSRGLP